MVTHPILRARDDESARNTFRAYDRYVIVDAITGSMLVGARHIEVECSDVHTAEAAVLLGLARVRGFVEFTSGSFSVQGLGAELASAWRTLEP